MSENLNEITNTKLYDELPKQLANKLDRFVELLNILLIVNDDNFEEKSDFLLNSEFYYKSDMYEMFISVSLNICFFWPEKIPIITKMFTIFHKKDETISLVTKRTIVNQILHCYFNNSRDDVYIYSLYLILYGIQYHDISRSELVNDIKQNFIRKRQFANQLSMIFLYFAPEIEAEDRNFYDKMKKYTYKCREKNLLCQKTLKFLDNFEYYRNNNWEMLIKNRNDFDCGEPILHAFRFDDLELFKKTLHLDDNSNSASFSKADLEQSIIIGDVDDENIDENLIINSYFNNPPLSLFTLFDMKFPLIAVATGFGAKNIFKYLYEKGASLDQPAENGATVTQLAAINPEEEIIQILQNENYDLREGMASFVRCFDIIKFKQFCSLFLGRRYDVVFNDEIKDSYSFQYIMSPTKSTVLVQSVLTTNFIALKMCLENKLIDINEPDGFDLTPLDTACQMGNKLIVEILVELGADFDRCNPLINAAMCGHSEIVNYFLGLTCDSNEEDQESKTVRDDDYLFRFSARQCYNHNITIPQDLINKADSKGVTPLYASISNSHYKVTRMLLMTNKIDLNRRFKDGLTYINIAASQNNVAILELIIEYVQIPFDEHEVPPLATAISCGMINSICYLLEKKRDQIDINKMIKTADISALWMAVKFSHPEIVTYLIEKQFCQVTPVEIDLATRNQDLEILGILNKYYYGVEKEENESDSDNNEEDHGDFNDDEEESVTDPMADDFSSSNKKCVCFNNI